MDQMSIKTAFTKGIISKILKKKIDKKFGDTSIEVRVQDFDINFNDGDGGVFRVSIEGVFEQSDILKLLKEVI